MATDSPTHRPSNRSSTRSFVDRHRELLFNGTLVLSVLAVSLGIAFLILAISLDTTPPSPYLSSTTDRILLFAFSLGSIALGWAFGRTSFRIGGW